MFFSTYGAAPEPFISHESPSARSGMGTPRDWGMSAGSDDSGSVESPEWQGEVPSPCPSKPGPIRATVSIRATHHGTGPRSAERMTGRRKSLPMLFQVGNVGILYTGRPTATESRSAPIEIRKPVSGSIPTSQAHRRPNHGNLDYP